MTDVVPLSAFLSIMLLSTHNCLSACSSPGMRLAFGFLRALISLLLGRFLKPQEAGLVDSSLISREMDVTLFLYRNICTGGAFVSQRDQSLLGVSTSCCFLLLRV